MSKVQRAPQVDAVFFNGRGWHNGKKIITAMEVDFMFVRKFPVRFAAEGKQIMYKATWKCQSGQSGQEKLATRQELQKLLHAKNTKIGF